MQIAYPSHAAQKPSGDDVDCRSSAGQSACRNGWRSRISLVEKLTGLTFFCPYRRSYLCDDLGTCWLGIMFGSINAVLYQA